MNGNESSPLMNDENTSRLKRQQLESPFTSASPVSRKGKEAKRFSGINSQVFNAAPSTADEFLEETAIETSSYFERPESRSSEITETNAIVEEEEESEVTISDSPNTSALPKEEEKTENGQIVEQTVFAKPAISPISSSVFPKTPQKKQVDESLCEFMMVEQEINLTARINELEEMLNVQIQKMEENEEGRKFEVEMMTKQNEALNKKLKESSKREKEMAAELASFKSQMESASAPAETNAEEMKKLEEARQKAEAEMQALMARNEELDAEFEEYRKIKDMELREKNSSIGDLMDELEKVHLGAVKAEKKYQQLTLKSEEADAKIQLLSAEKDELAEIVEVLTKSSDKSEEIDNLAQKLSQVRQEKDQLEELMTSQTRMLTETAEKVEALIQEAQILEQDLQESRKMNEELTSQINSISTDLEAVKLNHSEQIKTLAEENEQKVGNIQKLLDEAQEKLEEAERNAENLETLEKQLEETNEEKMQLIGQIKNMIEENEAKLAKEVGEKSNTIAILTAQIEQLNEEKVLAETNFNREMVENAEKTSNVQLLLDEANQTIANLNQKLVEAQEAAENSEKIESISKELEQSNSEKMQLINQIEALLDEKNGKSSKLEQSLEDANQEKSDLINQLKESSSKIEYLTKEVENAKEEKANMLIEMEKLAENGQRLKMMEAEIEKMGQVMASNEETKEKLRIAESSPLMNDKNTSRLKRQQLKSPFTSASPVSRIGKEAKRFSGINSQAFNAAPSTADKFLEETANETSSYFERPESRSSETTETNATVEEEENEVTILDSPITSTLPKEEKAENGRIVEQKVFIKPTISPISSEVFPKTPQKKQVDESLSPASADANTEELKKLEDTRQKAELLKQLEGERQKFATYAEIQEKEAAEEGLESNILDARIQEFESELMSARADLEKLRNQMSDNLIEKAQLVQDLARITVEKGNLHIKMAESMQIRQENEELKQKVTGLMDQIASKTEIVEASSENSAEIDELKTDKDMLEKLVKELNETIAETNAENLDIRDKFEKLTNSLQESSPKEGEMDKMLEERQQKVEELEKSLKNVTSSSQKWTEEQTRLEEMIEKLNGHNSKLAEELAEAKQKFVDASEQVDQQINQLTLEKDEMAKKIEELTGKDDQVGELTNELAEVRQSFEEKIRQLTAEKEELAQKALNSQQLELLSSQLAEANEVRRSADDQLDQIKIERDALTSKIEELIQKAAESQQALAEAQQIMLKADAKIQLLSAEKDELAGIVDVFSKSSDKSEEIARADLEQSRNQMSDNLIEKVQLEQDLAKITEEKDNLHIKMAVESVQESAGDLESARSFLDSSIVDQIVISHVPKLHPRRRVASPRLPKVERPYRCNTCDKRYKRKDALTVHKRRRTKVLCDCGASFTRKSSLTKHQRESCPRRWTN